jgi:hypothetical protein
MKNQQVYIKCKCGNEVVMRLVGGQYQYLYREKCICGKEWILDELSEDIEE